MKGYNVNEHLSAEENAHSVAYTSLVDENLLDALVRISAFVFVLLTNTRKIKLIIISSQLFSWFADADNFLGATRKAYSSLLSFPSRYFLPIQMRKNAVQRVQKYGGTVESGALVKAENTKVNNR